MTMELINGANLKLLYFNFQTNYGYVLAYSKERKEWVTWRVYPSNREEYEGKFEAEVGHYFPTKYDPEADYKALHDFYDRIGNIFRIDDLQDSDPAGQT